MLLLIAYLILSIFSWYYSFYLGISIFFIPFLAFILFSNFLKKFFDIEIASANDFVCYHAEANDGNHSHMVAAVIYENRLDGEEFIAKVKQRAFIHPYYNKLKKNLIIKNFGLFLIPFWRNYKDFDVNSHFVIYPEAINTDEELYDLVADHSSSEDFAPLQPKWKGFLIEKFKEDKSVFVMKLHHSYADGISSLSYFMNLTDCNEFEMVHMKKIGKLERGFAFLLGTLKIMVAYFHFLTWRKDINCFHTGKTSGKKKLFSSEACDLAELKQAAKEHEVSINDSLTAILSISLHKYCKEKFNENIENILAMIPVSLRPLPMPGDFYPIDNFCSVIYTQMPIKHDENVFTITKFYCKYMNGLKQSYDIYVSKLAYEVMPYIMTPWMLKNAIRFIANKVSFIFSNVPGPKNQMVCFGKHRVERVITSVNIFSDTLVVFSIISYNGKIHLTCISDKEISFCPREFIEIFKNYLQNDILKKK